MVQKCKKKKSNINKKIFFIITENKNKGNQPRDDNPPQHQQQTQQQQPQRQQGQNIQSSSRPNTRPQQGNDPSFQQTRQQQGIQQHEQRSQSQAFPPPGFPGWGQPSNVQVGQPVRQPQQQAWPSQQSGPPPGTSSQINPAQSQSQPLSPQKQEGVQKPKVKGNKYPKKEQQKAQIPIEPTPSTSSQPETDVTPISQKVEQLHLSPTKSLQVIESSPTGFQGSRGRKVNLEVNYLQILVKNLVPKAFHYDVEFDPNVPKKLLPVALDVFMKEHFRGKHFAFDGRKNFYTNQMLGINGTSYEKEVVAVLGDRSKSFKVKVQFATEVDMSVLKVYQDPIYQHNDKPSQAIQCLDVILRTVFKSLTARNQAVAVGRALYFASQGRPDDLGEGMELWYGLFQSAILGRRSLYLNVDVAHKAFPSAISVLDVLASFDRNGRPPAQLDIRQKQTLHDYLKMLSVGYQITPRDQVKTYGYNGLVDTPSKATFVDSDGQKMTVLDYFQRKKGISLRFPDLPCLHVGSKIRNIYLPLELCHIPAGQATNKKCTPNCVAKMIKFSATSTDDRKRKIQNLLSKVNYAANDGEIKGFGIDVDKKFQNVEGRVIDAPKIKYSSGSVTTKNGVWNGGQYLETQRGVQIKWGIINCDERTSLQAIMQLKDNILRESRRLRMSLADFHGENDVFSINAMRPRPGEMEDLLRKCQASGYKLVFVIIIDRNDWYAQVKQAAELKVGIMTQCIKANTIFRMGKGNPMMTIGNILLKVNAKLNGKNHEVEELSYQSNLRGGIMFVGADVTHPSPDQRDIPSVVGVAASYDDVGFRYQCAWRLQDPKKEMIEDLKAILVAHLQFYKTKNNNKLPIKIMYYR